MSVDTFLLSADTTDLNYPEVRPTLDLNFARVKALDPRITFTRASGGSYVGADGLIKLAGVNEARFDHDPVTGESLGLLIEEARTNLFTRSEDALNAWNIRVSSPIIENSIVAPDGTLTADSFIERTPSSGLGDHYLDRTIISQAANVPLSYSIYVKRLSGIRTVSLTLFANSNSSTISSSFNLDRVTSTKFSSGTGSILNSSITPLPNGWFRLSISGTPTTASVTDLRVRIQLITFSTTYIGDGTSGVYIWGAQLEAGDFPTSYIPTQASTRTRARDTASIVEKNFFDFYNQIDSALFFSGRRTIESTSARLFGGIVDTTKGFVSSIYFNTGGSPAIVAWSPIGGGAGDLGRYVQNTLVKGILTYTSSQPTASWCRDGGTVGSIFNRSFTFEGVTQFGFPNTMNRLVIGSSPWGFDAVLNGTISRLTYFPKRLPNAQLQALTR